MYGSVQVYFLNIKQYITYCMPYDGIASQQDLFIFFVNFIDNSSLLFETSIYTTGIY